MPPGRQPTVDGDDPDARTSGGASGVALQRSPGVLVGRGRELATITRAMAAARRGAARGSTWSGRPGSARRRWPSMRRRWPASRAGRWRGGARGVLLALPYWLWQQILGSLVRATDVATRVQPATVAWLVDLIPELAGSAHVPPVPALDPDRSRAALDRAVVHVLATAAADRPLLVVLDDVHDADAASLAVAALVCRGLPDSPLLVLTPNGRSGREARRPPRPCSESSPVKESRSRSVRWTRRRSRRRRRRWPMPSRLPRRWRGCVGQAAAIPSSSTSWCAGLPPGSRPGWRVRCR